MFSNILDTTDNTFVISSTSKAGGMWVSSPSASSENYVMYVGYDGRVSHDSSISDDYGFRPVVCLKSGVNLVQSGSDYTITEP